MSTETDQPKTQSAAAVASSDLLCQPFTPTEWHDVSLCIGWTVAMADNSSEGKERLKVSMRAMESMKRVFGPGFHTRIVEAVEKLQA